ncbi:MAG: deoxyribodipyrimidine photo-lyase [Rhodocyclaceae bacterium]|nr:deoxyribodipyrimidine photo-lyase [Rhodocyclaceae bacterium]
MTVLVWFRRDLRQDDHTALSRALATHDRVWCAFVFDKDILDPLLARGLRADRRVEFILRSVTELDAALRARGGGLIVRHGRARDEIPRLARDLGVDAVFANRDYEPDARRRDDAVAQQLAANGQNFRDFKDQVVFERDDILTGAGRPYAVFTPYRNAWLKRLTPADLQSQTTQGQAGCLMPPPAGDSLPTLAALGFVPSNLTELRLPAGMTGAQALFDAFLDRIDDYAATRDFPALEGSSALSPHLRFGTISIRTLADHAYRLALHAGKGAATWLNELIWREFYQMILWHHPRVVGHAFKPDCDALQWDDAPGLFAAWREGRTGYPLVDAAMRQIDRTGTMHNRLRMVVASFLVKDLGLDWRQGEQYFADHLLDFDLAANNGGWQWAASTGCDAQPWFRIFNPVTQSEKFDAEGKFIRRYLPELARVPAKHIHAPWRMSAAEQSACGTRIGRDYPAPVVDHASARERTLARYGKLRKASLP